MIFLETAAVAFAMFSAVPVPQPVWNKENMRYALCAFPLIGVVCALLWSGWMVLSDAMQVPELLRAAGLCLVPVWVTGGIHLDGYADTCDALASCAPPEKKQEILKDPRCGAFALIRLCTYFAAYLGLCAAVPNGERTLWCMSLAFVLERALSGLAVASFPLAKNTGLAHTFSTAADRTTVCRILLALSLILSGAMIVLGGVSGAAMAAAAALVFWRYHRTAVKQFGGLSGDLAGWFLQKAEIWMLAAFVLAELVKEQWR